MIISSYRLKPIQLLEKTNLAKEYQGWTTEGRGNSLSRISEKDFEGFALFGRILFSKGALPSFRRFRGWPQTVLQRLTSKHESLEPKYFHCSCPSSLCCATPPPPFNEQISIRCSGLQFKSFAVFGISWNGGEGRRESELFRVIATTVYI